VLTQTGGTINVSGEFHLLSNEDINASYLPKGGVLNVEGAKVFVHQHIVANPFWPFFLSSPTDSTNALNSGSGYLMAYYDNPTDTWVQIGANARMESGRGYSVYAQNNLVFRGNINRIAAGHTAVRTAGQGYGWNMFGNPFTAGLDWGGIVVDTTTLENSFWLWDPRQDKYTAFNSEAGLGTGDTEGVIPSNHGFVVKVKLEHLKSNIEMPPSATVANGPSLLKSSKMNKPPFVRIAVTKDNFEDRAVVAFIDNATAGTDKYDTEKKLGSSGPFELYSLGDGSRLSINSFPLLTGQRDVPLGLIVRKKGSYSLTLNDSNLEGVDVFLIDNLTEDIIDLKSVAEYTFSVDKTGTDVSRLALRFVGSLTTQLPNNPGLDTSENLKVFSQDKRIFYEVGEGLVGSVVSVFDSYGRLLHNDILNGSGRSSYEVFYPGVYLIKVSREGHIGVSQKVVVK
ncbi:MAG TPA: T9SS type A sorting domain-containing protein, partial [Bacteroidales bacterium]|nr:T9SS type A sorting domain-containing protein [Bacteroidales bacterium]